MKKSILAAAAVSLLAVSACGEADKSADTSGEASAMEGRNMVFLKSDAAALPEGIPMMPGVRLARRSHTYDYKEKSHRLSTDLFVKGASSEEIVDFYSEALKEEGYKVNTTHGDKYSSVYASNEVETINVRSSVDSHYLKDAEEGEAHASINQQVKGS